MVDSTKIAEHFPAAQDFRMKEITTFRGDVIFYRANVVKPSFSTDAQGFRHSTFDGRNWSVVECTQSPRYGITLGASNIFAPGVAGNENTIASRLAERFGFPFATAAMPSGNSRNLNSLLVGLLAGAKHPPAVIVLSNGGDLANFCAAGIVDPIFGSPNHLQIKNRPRQISEIDMDAEFPKLLVFTALWLSVTATLCQMRNIPLVLLHQSTFFEKGSATAVERECRLGEAKTDQRKRLFSDFAKYGPPFFARRQELARKFGLPIGGVGVTDRLTFFDEFHPDAAGLRLLSEAVGDVIEPLLMEKKPASRKQTASA
jgi:hypothetical protein